MSRPTGVSLKDYCKAVEICVAERGYSHVNHDYVKGSIYGFQVFEKQNDSEPCAIWSIHFSHNKKKELWSDDLAKAYERTAIPKEHFVGVLKKITKGKGKF